MIHRSVDHRTAEARSGSRTSQMVNERAMLVQDYQQKIKELTLALTKSEDELQEDRANHIEAFTRLQDARDLAMEAAKTEKDSLITDLDTKTIKLDQLTRQLLDRETNLEALRSQARQREHLLSNLQEDLEHKGNSLAQPCFMCGKYFQGQPQQSSLNGSNALIFYIVLVQLF